MKIFNGGQEMNYELKQYDKVLYITLQPIDWK